MNSLEHVNELYQEIQNGRFTEPEDTYKLCSELYSIGEYRNDEYIKNYALLYMADIDITLGDLNNALLITKDVIKRTQEHKHLELLMKAYNLVALIFSIEHDDVMAVTYCLKGLSLAEQEQNNYMLGLFYTNIGSTFSSYDSEFGLQYLVKSLKLSDEAELLNEYKTMDESSQYNREILICNIAVSYVYSHNYEKALSILEDYFGLDKIPTFAKIPYFYVLIKSYHHMHLTKEATQACRKASCFRISELNSAEDFLLYVEIIKEYMKLVSYPEGKLLLDRLQAEENKKGNAINQTILYSLYIEYYQHENRKDMLFDSYRSYYKYYKLGQEMLRKNNIDSINKRIALTQEQEISNHYMQDAQHLEILSKIDTLTGLSNRYGLNQYYREHFANAQENSQTFGIMIIDIDCFKSFNDTMGHLAGDSCIRQVASILSDSLNSDFFAARFGGDEFFITCQNVSMEQFCEQAALLVKNVSDAKISFPSYQPYEHVTISLGGINTIPTSSMSVDDFVRSADSALYDAKESSRNTYKLLSDIHSGSVLP